MYTRAGNGTTDEKGFRLTRNGNGTYTLTTAQLLTYQFSAATADAYLYCRLESIKDANNQSITLSYNGAVGTGKLTKVTPPGDSRYLQLSYSGNLVTKAELKKDAAALLSVTYAYDGNNELTKVTDPSGTTDVDLTYGSYAYDATSRYLSTITDRDGTVTDLDWSFRSITGATRPTAST